MLPARSERREYRWSRIVFLTLVLCCLASASAAQSSSDPHAPGAAAGRAPLPPGSWRFIVSGDSRNCGDVVMPAIAAHSARFAPSFYWHLGDLRAISKIDEDIAFNNVNIGRTISCETYHRIAWSDFIANQIAAFGDVTFYLGIGNHEAILPKGEDAFKREFADWLDQPFLHTQREKDKEPSQPEPYYHWIQGGVDFIYLDNASGFFSEQQLQWLEHRLASAKSDAAVKSVVVGMHEALPDSLTNDHSMGDGKSGPNARPSGARAYKDLVAFRDENHNKPVYVLASHSHFFMENIFNSPPLTQGGAKPLDGWIVGTAGATRAVLPKNPPPTAKTDVYGYLLGTVSADGTVQFDFEEIQAVDVPQYVWQRYPAAQVLWCFKSNSLNSDPNGANLTASCPTPSAGGSAH